MALTKIELEHFTAFSNLALELSPGINVLVGANGTGKTHLMKVCYAACDVSKTGAPFAFAEKLVRVFLPLGGALGRLVKRQKVSAAGEVTVRCTLPLSEYTEATHVSDRQKSRIVRRRISPRLHLLFSNHTKAPASATVIGAKRWARQPIECVYIPVKEMLSNAPGFLSLYAEREIHFEEVYADILHRAYRPLLRGPVDDRRKRLLTKLQKVIDGKITVRNEEFFLRNKQGNLEFTLLAEGMRKLGLLWLLIQNGALQNGSVLFWDEPETNLNPKLFGVLIDILLELQRDGVQIFLATHDYVILEELNLQKKARDKVAFHSLYREEGTEEIACNTTDSYLDIHPNVIAETFTDLYDREIERSLKGSTG